MELILCHLMGSYETGGIPSPRDQWHEEEMTLTILNEEFETIVETILWEGQFAWYFDNAKDNARMAFADFDEDEDKEGYFLSPDQEEIIVYDFIEDEVISTIEIDIGEYEDIVMFEPMVLRSDNEPLAGILMVGSEGTLWFLEAGSDEPTCIEEEVIPTILDGCVGDFDNDDLPEIALLSESTLTIYDIEPLTVSDEKRGDLIANRFSIVSAYPNPFNSAATVEFTLPASGRYEITVNDLAGREVMRLADGWRVQGEYSLTWNATGMQSGTYFIIVDADRRKAVRGIQLVK